MRYTRPLTALALCLTALALMGKKPPQQEDRPPPTDTLEKTNDSLRPKMESNSEINTLIGTIPGLDGYEEKTSTNGTVRLINTADGVTIVIDALSADSVDDGGYDPDSVRAILAKQFEPRVVKDAEEPGGDVSLRFRGYGAVEDGSVAFVLDMVDTPSRGPGMVLVFGPNSQREQFEVMTAQVITMLITAT